LVIVRENTEGLYVGMDRTFKVGGDPKALAQATSVMTRDGCRRIVRYAFEYAKQHGRKKVTVVHKANILKATSGLFLETARLIAQEYQGQIASDDKIVDNAAMQLVINPAQFDVIVTTNLFGDILSDEASGLVGGLGLAPGANIGETAAIFEAVHGSAPDIAGQGIANPSAQMLAAAMLLDHIGELDAANRLRGAPETAIVTDNVRAHDLAGDRQGCGSGRRGGVVSPDLSHRKEGRAGMVTMTLDVARRTLPVLAGLAVVGPLAAQTSLSIYSDGRVVVRRTLPQALEKGRNTLTLRLEGLDPATLFSPDTSVALVSAVLRPPTERGAALESALGQTLSFVRTKGDTVRATVLRVAPPQYRLSDGRLLLSEPGEPLFPAELVRTAPED